MAHSDPHPARPKASRLRSQIACSNASSVRSVFNDFASVEAFDPRLTRLRQARSPKTRSAAQGGGSALHDGAAFERCQMGPGIGEVLAVLETMRMADIAIGADHKLAR
jgi:hypothetical protein